MSSEVIFNRTPFPNVQFAGDIDALFDLFVAHLEGNIEGVFVGQINGAEPTEDIGLWLNNNVWEAWSSTASKYLPIPLTTGRLYNSILRKTTLLSGATTGDVTLTLPDKNGATIATTSDVFTPVPTVTVAGSGTASCDMNTNSRFYILLSVDTNIFCHNMTDGEVMHIYVENPQSGTNVVSFHTLPTVADIYWDNGTLASPVQTAGDSTHRAVDHYIIERVGTLYFGRKTPGYLIPTTGGSADTTAPTMLTFVANFDTVGMTASELLRNGALTIAEFVVKKNGATQTVSSADASGANVTLVLANSFVSSDVITVQYLNTVHSVKDLAGNNMAAFAATTCVNATPGGGGGGFGLHGGRTGGTLFPAHEPQ